MPAPAMRAPALPFALLLVGGLVVAGSPLNGLTQRPPSAGLLDSNGLEYEGAFRLPGGGETDEEKWNYGGAPIAFDPWRRSIWGVGHDQQQRIGEFTIPTPVVGPLSSLPRAEQKTPFFDTSWRTQVMSSTVKIGGILPQPNGDLIVSAFAYYDSGNRQVTSHFRRAADGAVSGPFRLNTSRHSVNPGKAGAVSGYMFWIPPEWQAAFGGPAVTGNCCLSIITRTSLGPALTVFDPGQLGSADPVPSREILGYPHRSPTLGTTAEGLLYNGSVNNNFAGMVWITGTRTVLAIQKIGTGTVVYKAGYTAGQNILMVLAYDAQDLLAVRNGRKRAHAVEPYAHWQLDHPLGSVDGRTDRQSITHDPATGRIFMTIHTGIPGGEHVVLVYRPRVKGRP
jgi:hypothetical protein